jgi:threonine/homoserine/homoserine lactone efflux protein
MQDYLLFATAFFAAAIAPGADTLLILTKAITSKRLAVIAGAGITLGKILMVSIAYLGLSSLVDSFPAALIALKIFGAGFLLFKAYGMWRAQGPKQRESKGQGEFFAAFAIGFSNPQPFAFYLAIVPLVIGTTYLPILLGIVVLGFALVTFIYISLASALSVWIRSKSNYQLVNRVLAAIFVVLAIVIAIR